MKARARNGVRRAGRARRPLAALFAAALAVGGPAPAAHARAAAAPGLAVALLGGSTLPDTRLRDYSWDVAPRAGWGAQATLEFGGWRVGTRAWRTATVQRIDLPGGPLAPTVESTSLELLARRRLAGASGNRLWAGAAVGRLHLGYHPDHVSVPTGGSPLDVTLAPVDAWTAGAELALDRPLRGAWTLGLSAGRRLFALDTAHRSGAEVVYQRESFGDWSGRLELARSFSLLRKGSPR